MNSRMFRILTPLLLPLLIFIISCTNDDLLQITTGDNFINSQTSVVVIDSFTVNLSTVMIDSIPTSGSGSLLIGKYADDYLGIISSHSYFKLNNPNSTEINDDAVYDSLKLVLKYNGDSYGDTLQPQTFRVHRVLDEIEPNGNDTYLYNTSSFEYDETPLGSSTFYPKPNTKDTITIKLNDALGQRFMKLLKEKADTITKSERFLDFFKGLAVVPDENNSCILGFEGADSLINMVLYTHYIGATKVETKYSFPLYKTSTCFNHIESDRSGTLIEPLKTQREELPASSTGDMAFLEGGLGLVTRVDIPSLSLLLQMDYRKILYKADLIMKPYRKSYPGEELPKQLILYNTNKYNALASEITNSKGESIYAKFNLDKFYPDNNYYVFDLTSIVSDELSDGYVDENAGLIISIPPSQMRGSLSRIAFDARKGLSYKPVLKLYYVFYN